MNESSDHSAPYGCFKNNLRHRTLPSTVKDPEKKEVSSGSLPPRSRSHPIYHEYLSKFPNLTCSTSPSDSRRLFENVRNMLNENSVPVRSASTEDLALNFTRERRRLETLNAFISYY